LFLRNGAYGRFNLTAVACYLAGIACEVPFVNTAVYEGPMAISLKGADISWIICLAVISPLYYLARLATTRRHLVPRDAQDSTSMRNIYLSTDGGPG